MIVFDAVSKQFGTVVAVHAFSLTIAEREILGLLGPNGAGKTTLILTLATVYRPSAGTIRVFNHDVRQAPNTVRQLISISFQDPKHDRLLSVEEVLRWHAKVTGVPAAIREERIQSVLRELDLWEVRRRGTWALSGGMKKKVENAKVFVQRPRIAIFDEPTAFLDVPSRRLVWDLIRQLREEGSTVILATNMMDEAERVADRVAIMNLGRLVAVGTPQDLKMGLPTGEALELRLANAGAFDLGVLRQIDGVLSVVGIDGGLRLLVRDGRRLIPRVIQLLHNQGVVVESLELKEPTLEDVFLQYTGAKLR